MIYGERTPRSAFYVSDNSIQKLSRIPFMSATYNEEWLQRLIEENPSMIPSGDVSIEYAPLVCIGREVPVGAGDTKGYIDNLYVTPSGSIVIVETKLWRNQESRRTVVAQIIDYAKELQKWDAAALNAVAEDYTFRRNGQGMRIIDIMAKAGHLTFSDEAAFTDCLNRNLQSASFLLMIIGDGIRSNVQQLAEFLNDNTDMSFNLALVELEIYQQTDGLCIVPNLISKTTVIERRSANDLPAVFSKPADGTYQLRQRYIPRPVLSRRDFLEVFSERSGFDPDLITEFIADIDSVDGISINITPTELHIDCSPDGIRRITVMYFGISGSSEASIYVRPDRLIRGFTDCGEKRSGADSFLEFYKEYIDLRRCKSSPYEFGADRFYYADLDKVLCRSAKFVEAFEQLVQQVSE